MGWDDYVTADRTDAGTLALLGAWLGGTGVADAVHAAMEAVGKDDLHHSRLVGMAREAVA